jgi:hypothetical protein
MQTELILDDDRNAEKLSKPKRLMHQSTELCSQREIIKQGKYGGMLSFHWNGKVLKGTFNVCTNSGVETHCLQIYCFIVCYSLCRQKEFEAKYSYLG